MKTRQETYNLRGLDLRALNTILVKIGLRLDNLDGIGQTTELNGRRIANVGDAKQEQDALPYGQAQSEFEEIGKFLSVTDKPVTENDNSLLFQNANSISDESLFLLVGKNTVPYKNPLEGSQIVSIRIINTATYTVKIDDYELSVIYTTTGAVTITIPVDQNITGRTIIISDDADNASINNIIVEDDTPTILFTINADGASMKLLYTGAAWRIR